MSFNITTGSIDQFRRSVPLADASIANPNATLPLLDGEFLINTASGYARLTASTSNDVDLTLAQGKPVPVFSQSGDTAVQALDKVSVIDSGPDFRVRTDVYQTDGKSLGDYAVTTKLTITAPDADGSDPHAGRSVLAPAASGDPVVGVVEVAPTVLGGDMQVRINNAVPVAAP